MASPRGLRRADLAIAGLLFVLAAWLRLRNFWDLPVHRDWPWFLRVSGDLLAGRSPEGPYAYLYTSVPAALFALALKVTGGLVGALRLWSLLAALAAPILFWALRERIGRLAAALAAGVLVLLPVDLAWGRGLESPYLVSSFVAVLTLGLLLGHQRRALGPPLTVLGAAGAAGMHLGLAPLVVAACLVAGWDLIRQGSHRLLSLAGCLAIGAPFAAVVWFFDRSRLEDDLNMRGAAIDAFGDAARAGRFELLTELPASVGLGGVRGIVLAGLLLVLLALPLVFRPGGSVEPPEPQPRLRLGGLLAVGLAPYVVMGLKVGYLSDDHAAGLLPLGLALLLLLAQRPALPELARRWGPRLLPALWIVALLTSSSFWGLVGGSDSSGPTELEEALELRDQIASLTGPSDSDAWVLVERQAGFDLFEGRQANLLNELLRLPAPPAEAPDSCFLLVAEGRGLPDSLEAVPVEQREGEGAFALWHDPGCRAVMTQGAAICSALPGGLEGRHPPRIVRYLPPFDGRQLPCLVP